MVKKESPQLPPHDLAAEEAVLGCILLSGELMNEAEDLQPEMFFREQNRWLFEAIRRVWNKGMAIDQVTVGHELSLGGHLEDIGGAAYLLHLQSIAPATMEVRHYAAIVRRAALCRSIIEVAGQIAALGYRADRPEESLDTAHRLLLGLQPMGDESGTPSDLAEKLMGFLSPAKRTQKVWHLPWKSVEDITGPLLPGRVWIVGAKTSYGKTTFLHQVALWAASEGAVVLYASAEELQEDFALKEATMTHGVRLPYIVKGQISEQDESGIVAASGDIAGRKLYMPRVHKLPSVQRWIRSIKTKEGRIDLLFLDYIQRFLPQGRDRYAETTQLTDLMKDVAVQERIPLVAASQMSRGSFYREDKTPHLEDLRDSGSIEQDADLVLFLHRDAAKKGHSADPDLLHVMVLKNRLLGAIGKASLRWDKERWCYNEEQEELL